MNRDESGQEWAWSKAEVKRRAEIDGVAEATDRGSIERALGRYVVNAALMYRQYSLPSETEVSDAPSGA